MTCPVCRKPISEGSGSEADQAAAQSAAAQRARLADDWLAADLAFRLGVLQTCASWGGRGSSGGGVQLQLWSCNTGAGMCLY